MTRDNGRTEAAFAALRFARRGYGCRSNRWGLYWYGGYYHRLLSATYKVVISASYLIKGVTFLGCAFLVW